MVIYILILGINRPAASSGVFSVETLRGLKLVISIMRHKWRGINPPEIKIMIKQTPSQRKMKQRASNKKYRDKKRAEKAFTREMKKQAVERANKCSESWVPCHPLNNINKPSIKKLSSNDEANELFNEAKSTILRFENLAKKIKRLFYQLELGDAFIGLGYKSEKVVFKELSEVSLLNLSMLQRFRNAAIIEVELGLLHDQIPTKVLLELKVGTNAEHRKEIWKLVNIDCLHFGRSDDGKFPLPTVKQVNIIKRNYLYNTPQAIAKRAYLDDIMYDGEINLSDSNVEIPVDEWTEKYSSSQLREFEKDYKAAFESEDDTYDLTDEQIEKFNKDYHQALLSVN